MTPSWVAVKRITRNIKGDIIRQVNGKVFFLFRHDAAVITMHHRYRTAPITLTAQAPISQAVLGFTIAKTLRFGPIDGSINGLLASGLGEASRLVDPADLLRFHRHKSSFVDRQIIIQGKECINHRQIIFPSKIKVALIMGRASKDSTCTVIHHHKISHPNRQRRATQGVLHGDACVKTLFLGLFHCRFGGVHLFAFSTEGFQCRILHSQTLGQRMVGRQSNEGGAHQCVGPRSINSDPTVAILRRRQRESHLKATGFSNPVFLHQAHFRGPVFEII